MARQQASKKGKGPTSKGSKELSTIKKHQQQGSRGRLRGGSTTAPSRESTPAPRQPSPSPLSSLARPEASPDAEPAAAAAAEASEAGMEAAEPAPGPAAAAKARASHRQTAQAVAARKHADERQRQQLQQSITMLADAAEEAADMELEAAAAMEDGAGSDWEEREEGRVDGPPACRLIASGPGFKLARSTHPPCFRAWITLQAPASADCISVRCSRRYIAVTQRQPGAAAGSPDGICLPPPVPLRAHHLVLPEELDLAVPAYCLVTPQGEMYVEAAIRRRA